MCTDQIPDAAGDHTLFLYSLPVSLIQKDWMGTEKASKTERKKKKTAGRGREDCITRTSCRREEARKERRRNTHLLPLGLGHIFLSENSERCKKRRRQRDDDNGMCV